LLLLLLELCIKAVAGCCLTVIEDMHGAMLGALPANGRSNT